MIAMKNERERNCNFIRTYRFHSFVGMIMCFVLTSVALLRGTIFLASTAYGILLCPSAASGDTPMTPSSYLQDTSCAGLFASPAQHCFTMKGDCINDNSSQNQ